MLIRISRAELVQTTMKLFEALGFPHGFERDAACNIAWLEDRSLDGIGLVLDLLAGPTAAWSPPDIRSGSDGCVIAAGAATGLLLAPVAFDHLSLHQRVTVRESRALSAYVAETARRGSAPFGYRVELASGQVLAWCGGGTAEVLSASVPPVGTVTISPDPEYRGPATIGSRDREDGFDVNADSWRLIVLAARPVLVPASARSRGGAGAEVDDSA